MTLPPALARLWPFRRPADPAAVREFRIAGRPELHRVEAGTPLADARDRGAVVLFEADDVGRYMIGRAANDKGRPVAMICGWTSYSKGAVSDVEGNVSDKRVAVAWGFPIEGAAVSESPAVDVNGPFAGASMTEASDALMRAVAKSVPPKPRRTRAKGVPQAKRGG